MIDPHTCHALDSTTHSCRSDLQCHSSLVLGEGPFGKLSVQVEVVDVLSHVRQGHAHEGADLRTWLHARYGLLDNAAIIPSPRKRTHAYHTNHLEGVCDQELSL